MLRKIGDVQEPCYSPEHNPPTMIVLSPGVYEHTCSACGYKIAFTVYGHQWITAEATRSTGQTSCFVNRITHVTPQRKVACPDNYACGS